MNKIKRITICLLLGFVIPYTLPAQAEWSGVVPGEDLVVKVALFGPGTELYFWWGHIALIIENTRTRQARSFDFGLFSLENAEFFVNFAFGRLWYSSGMIPAAISIGGYVNNNRSVTLFTLDLPPERREAVLAFAEYSVRPENRYYLYHHFDDNCSTRIRDILDIATYGQFSEAFLYKPGRFTFRQHIRRHTWHSPFFDWILNFWMGQGIDAPITVWQEMFLPSEVAKRITEFTFTDSYGNIRQLVSDIEYYFEAEGRPPVLDIPRQRWPHALALSLAVALFLGFLFFVQSKSPAAGQVALGICHSLFGLVFGITGLMLFFMSTFTAHDYTFNNINLFFCNPLLLAAIPLGIKYASASCYNKRLFIELSLRLLWLLTFLGIIVSMLVKLSPHFWQQNLTDQLLLLPIALILAFEPKGLRRLIERIFWRWI